MSVWRTGPRPQAPSRAKGDPWQPTFPFQFGSIGRSYQDIDPTIGETSLQSIAFRSGCDLIASIVSELPVNIYSGLGRDRKLRSTPGYLDDPSGDGHGREDWSYQWLMSWLLAGNSFASIIDQGPTGMIRQADIWHPDTISVFLENGVPRWRVSGETIPDRVMYHKRVNPVPGTLMGLSPIKAHADTLGLTLATTRFGRTWFQDGGHPGGILSNDQADMSDEKVVTKAKDRFMAALFGAREPIVLGKGWKFEQIQVAPEESQFLETSGFSEAQAARILGAGVAEVLGYGQTGSSITYTSMVDRDIALLKYAVGRWINRMERVWFGWLPRPQYAVLDRDAFLETSAMQRWQLNKIKLDAGAYTINQIREKENDQPVAWGDKPFTVKIGAGTTSPADPNANPTQGA